MTIYYLDPSAWIKRHFQEDGTQAVTALFSGAGQFACCGLGLVEMVATVARKCKGASLDAQTTATRLENVKADFSAFQVVPVDEACIDAAIHLAEEYRVRAMDAIHLACALALGSAGDVTVVSSDQEPLDAASLEGLVILDPTKGSP